MMRKLEVCPLKSYALRAISALLFVLLLAAGCGQSSQTTPDTPAASPSPPPNRPTNGESSAPSSATVKDASGRTVTVDLPLERAAILDNGTGEILSALGVLDKLVGNHLTLDNNELYPELKGVPVVATHSEINFEKLAEVRPQVVFSSVRAHGVVEDEEHLRGFRIKDIKLNLRNPDTMKDEVLLLGNVFQREQEAQRIVDFYNKYEKLIASRVAKVPQEKRPRVFVEYHAGDFKTGGPGSRFYQQVLLAGGVNLAAGLEGEPQVSDEWVAENNPDVVLREVAGIGYSVSSYNNARQIRQEIVNRPALAGTKAIRDDAVYLLSVDLYSRPGYIVGVSYLAKWLYPELFADFDPEQVHEEYMTLFHPGKPLQGVWAYTGTEGE